MFFTEQQKQIYTSPVGTLHDPVQVSNKLVAVSQGQFNPLLDIWYSEEASVEDRANAALKLAEVARQVFVFKPLSGTEGVGDGVVLEVIHHFMEFLAKKD